MRIGTVPYLNALPLTQHLNRELIKMVPSELPVALIDGRVDVALLPIHAIIKNKLRMHPDAGIIGCHGTVKSVGFFTRSYINDLSEIRSLYLDSESLTSAYLAKVLLKKYYGVNLADLEFFHDDNRHMADAQVLIGDKALFFDHAKHAYRYWDLGEIWQEHTGHGFMFACWASKRILTPDEISELAAARDWGMSHIDEICNAQPAENRELLKDYFKNNIAYEATSDIKDGLKLYKEFLAEYKYSEPPLPHHKQKWAMQNTRHASL